MQQSNNVDGMFLKIHELLKEPVGVAKAPSISSIFEINKVRPVANMSKAFSNHALFFISAKIQSHPISNIIVCDVVIDSETW